MYFLDQGTYNINMYIYRLINFKENAYLFTRNGNLVYDYTRFPALGNNWNNPKAGDYCNIYYFDYKNKKKRNRKARLTLIKIDFLTIPEEIQGLFCFYRKDINSIKNSMSLYKWNQFLTNYGEKVC